MARGTEDIRNMRYGRLTVLNELPVYNYKGSISWKVICICDPTKVFTVTANNLRRGNTRSCGCLALEERRTNRYFISDYRKIYDNRIIGDAYSSYRTRANSNGITFNLSYEDFKKIITQPCHYCGKEGNMKKIHYQTKLHKAIINGIDRMNNDLGYDIYNCVPCCKSCNCRKRDRPVQYILNRNKDLGIAA